VRGHRRALPDERDVVQEFAALRLVERAPGLYRYNHDPGRHDDVVAAIGLVAHRLLDKPPVSLGMPIGVGGESLGASAPASHPPWHGVADVSLSLKERSHPAA
jgi:hypothetical protein